MHQYIYLTYSTEWTQKNISEKNYQLQSCAPTSESASWRPDWSTTSSWRTTDTDTAWSSVSWVGHARRCPWRARTRTWPSGTGRESLWTVPTNDWQQQRHRNRERMRPVWDCWTPDSRPKFSQTCWQKQTDKVTLRLLAHYQIPTSSSTSWKCKIISVHQWKLDSSE